MPILSIVFGLLLIGLGAWGYHGSGEKTALIPAVAGGLLVITGVIGLIERMLKHAMHAAAMVGLLGAGLAGGRFVYTAVKKSGINFHSPATQSTLAMTVLCGLFLALCINSFIQARRRRHAAQSLPPSNPPSL